METSIDSIEVNGRHRKDLGNLDGLAESIAECGLMHPIVVTPDNALIAGERRLEACKMLGWESIPVTVVSMADVVRGEHDENAQRKDFLPSEIDAIRRALEPAQRAAAKERQGTRTDLCETFAQVDGKQRATDKVGAFAGVSGRTVEKIAKVVEAAEQEPERFGHLVEEMDRTGRVDGAYKKFQQAQMPRVREKQRIENTLSGHYAVFYADPPWQYSNSGFVGSAQSHYNTMPTDEICEMRVCDYAGENAVLFLWVTNPLLKDGLRVLEAWGFRYVTNWVWVKDVEMYGKLGFYNYGRHELLLLGVKGSFLPEGDLPNSVIEAPKSEHSRKPECVYQMIESLYPSSRRVELFQRGAREGWEGFGNEAG